ncbi:MAG: DeoR family transcriptional regulator, partial [Deltaproteobacteria bacterium]|nr:DeoR family transcriptional regulator [Deltaproteobacteria bacterium]
NATVCLCHISEVNAFFTDENPSPEIAKILSASGVDLFVAEQEKPGSDQGPEMK